jgi:hypothetical protein
MPKESYLQELVERALHRQPVKTQNGQRLKPKKSSYGLLAKYGPGPTDEEIDEAAGRCFAASASLNRDRGRRRHPRRPVVFAEEPPAL